MKPKIDYVSLALAAALYGSGPAFATDYGSWLASGFDCHIPVSPILAKLGIPFTPLQFGPPSKRPAIKG
jgi:hypothetical protein